MQYTVKSSIYVFINIHVFFIIDISVDT